MPEMKVPVAPHRDRYRGVVCQGRSDALFELGRIQIADNNQQQSRRFHRLPVITAQVLQRQVWNRFNCPLRPIQIRMTGVGYAFLQPLQVGIRIVGIVT